MDVREFVAANAAEFSQALREWLAIPSVSADPARHGDVRQSAEWLAGYLTKTGFPIVEVWETEGPARGLRALARRRREGAQGARVRPSRRAAGRAGRRLGLRAVRARRARRADLRPRRLRRQGPGAVPRARPARLPGRRRRRSTTRLDHHAHRGRGGVRLPALRRPAPRPRGPAQLRRDRDQRHHDVGGGRAVDLHRHARPRGGRDHAGGADARPALGVVRRRRAEPGARARGAAGRPARRRREGDAARLLRRRAPAVRRRARTAREAPLRRRAVADRRRRQPARSPARPATRR